MFRFIYKTFARVTSAVRHSQSHSFYYRIHPSWKRLQSVDTSPNQYSFAASYLIHSCGFPPDKALSTSRYLKFEAPDKPDSVLAFFNNHGFTKNQILRLVRTHPVVLLSDPEKTLLPKIEFFKSQGISSADVTKILSKNPVAFTRSLRNKIIPSFEFLNNLLHSKEKTIATIKRDGRILLCNHKTYTIPNIEALQEVDLPHQHIAFLLSSQPALFLCCSNRLKEVVEAIKKMGFNPLKVTFARAVWAMRTMTKSTWEKKLEVYKKWGWSEEQTLSVFRKLPGIMLASEDKIMGHMDYLINKMGQDSSCIQKYPAVITLSLEKRIIPRCELHEVLLSKGLIVRESHNLLQTLKYTEERFLKFLNSHEEEAPKLLKLYEEKLALAK